MPEMPDVPFFTLAPDWICEVLSPSTGARDRADKLPIYAREGTEVLRRDGDRFGTLLATYAGEKRVRAEPFDAVELDLALLWSR